MINCDTCGKKIGFFEKRYKDKEKRYCYECAKPLIAIEEEKKKKEEKRKKEEELLNKIINIIKEEQEPIPDKFNYNEGLDFYYGLEGYFSNVSIIDTEKTKDVLLIKIKATFSYRCYDFRHTHENMMSWKKFGFENHIGNLIRYINYFEKDELPQKIIIKFYDDEIDEYGHPELCYYSTIQIDLKTLNKINFDNLCNYGIANLFIKEISNFPNRLG